ncbi:MAG: AAA family ATPase [Campylobacterota bacterium]|nr:AAA family ATPase [Campylobacterota bacterium]
MAKELAHFKNFAKLKDTKVAFNDITVIAGKPGTGKSYVMKFMYGINEAPFVDTHKPNSLASKISSGDFELKDIDEGLTQSYTNTLRSIFGNLNQISSKFSVIYQNIELAYKNSELIFNRRENKSYSLSNDCIFVETPLILEFKKFMRREEGKTPYHIESLLNILDTDYSFTDEEQDKFIKNFTEKSKEIIKGDIESSGDSFIFNKDNDKNYDIVNASSGTKSIGLLQYLVTNKALKKGSVLYWEEPEVHLHPEWQLRMVDLFIELMNVGVKIVFSTHSPFMADYLNAISKREDFRDRISFNVFEEKDGVVDNYILDESNWTILQSELMDSFEDILWTYL